MNSNFPRQIIDKVALLFKFVWHSSVGRSVVFILSVLTALQALGVLPSILLAITSYIVITLNAVSKLYFGVPLIIWLAIIITIGYLFFWVFNLSRYLDLIAGEFKDDFREGLSKWSYGGEGWTTERDDGPVLSVMNSADGGITQAGLWDCFSFSFENKLLGNGKIGWIVKARDRSNYMMLQLIILETDGTGSEAGLRAGVYVRPHFRLKGDWLIRPHEQLTLSEKLQTLIRRYSWFKVNIQVRGNTLDLHLENEHVYHLYLDDPLRSTQPENLAYRNERGQDAGTFQWGNLNVFSYSQGRVGFRCSPTDEHAHIRRVRVRPTW